MPGRVSVTSAEFIRHIGHWQAEPHERVVAEVYVDDPRTAIRTALSASNKDD